ncbi:MAG: DUF1800 family protein, partial [Verrucomicrobiota bacterium]
MLTKLPSQRWSPRMADHLLFRAGFGGDPTRRKALFELGKSGGVEAAVDSLLGGTLPWDDHPVPQIPIDDRSVAYDREQRYAFVGWFVRQMHELPPVPVKMFKFFVDHFPIDRDVLARPQIYEQFYGHFDILRRGALGNFRELVKAVSWSAG